VSDVGLLLCIQFFPILNPYRPLRPYTGPCRPGDAIYVCKIWMPGEG
jgi:hypothetical protein